MAIAVSVGNVLVFALFDGKKTPLLLLIAGQENYSNPRHEFSVFEQLCKSFSYFAKIKDKMKRFTIATLEVFGIFIIVAIVFALTSCSKTRMDYNRLEGKWVSGGSTLEFSPKKDSTLSFDGSPDYRYYIDGKTKTLFIRYYPYKSGAFKANVYNIDRDGLYLPNINSIDYWQRAD